MSLKGALPLRAVTRELTLVNLLVSYVHPRRRPMQNKCLFLITQIGITVLKIGLHWIAHASMVCLSEPPPALLVKFLSALMDMDALHLHATMEFSLALIWPRLLLDAPLSLTTVLRMSIWSSQPFSVACLWKKLMEIARMPFLARLVKDARKELA